MLFSFVTSDEDKRLRRRLYSGAARWLLANHFWTEGNNGSANGWDGVQCYGLFAAVELQLLLQLQTYVVQ